MAFVWPCPSDVLIHVDEHATADTIPQGKPQVIIFLKIGVVWSAKAGFGVNQLPPGNILMSYIHAGFSLRCVSHWLLRGLSVISEDSGL